MFLRESRVVNVDILIDILLRALMLRKKLTIAFVEKINNFLLCLCMHLYLK